MKSPVHSIPEFEVRVAGRAVVRALLHHVVEVSINERLSLPTQAEVTFFFSAATEFPQIADTGDELSILIEAKNMFQGDVTAIEYEIPSTGGRLIRVRGYDQLHRMRKRQSVRSFEQMSFRELTVRLADESGLSVSDNVGGATNRRRFQHCQSDFELLSEAAEFCGQYFTVRGRTLHLLTMSGLAGRAELTLGENLREARFEVNADAACGAVETLGWDPATVSAQNGSATSARSGRKVRSRPTASQAGGDDKRTVAGHVLASQQEARDYAQGILDRRAAADVTVEGVADGNPDVHAGDQVQVQVQEASIDGQYVVCSVRHTIDGEKGYVTEFSSSPPLPRPRRTGTAATWGVVTEIHDPEGRGRVRVRLPAYQQMETDWISVVAPGAGANKGLIAMPDRGDNVLVVMLHDDPAQSVVIGGISNRKDLPDGGGIEKNRVRRFSLLTPGGQSVSLNDGTNSVRVQNKSGSFVQMTPDETTIHANSDLTIAAPGRTVFIRGGAIRFEEA